MCSFASPFAQKFDSDLGADACGDRELTGSASKQASDMQPGRDVVHAVMFEHDAIRLAAPRMWHGCNWESIDVPSLEPGGQDERSGGMEIARMGGHPPIAAHTGNMCHAA
jgi:hypothetical protein